MVILIRNNPVWHVHWLQAGGSLEAWRTAIQSEIDEACQALAGVMPPRPVDILVRRVAGTVIPSIGFGGRARDRSLFELRFDPENPNFGRSIQEGSLRRHVVHEAHHCMRMDGPGYGRTLGEALVSEGLAGQFVNRVFNSPPEPWERSPDGECLESLLPDDAALWSRRYDHAGWFFGAGGKHRDGLGYALGYWLAGRWRHEAPPEGPEAWVDVPAPTVIAAARRAMHRGRGLA